MSVRNEERFLRQCVDSILAQTYQRFEFIVVDDGSIDRSGEILNAYAACDSRVRVLKARSSGISAAINQGAECMSGRLIARMDGDDIAEPARLEGQVDYLFKHPEILAVGSAVNEVDETGRLGRLRQFPTDPAAVAMALPRSNVMAQSSVMIRREAYEQVGGYRPAFELGEDYDLWLRLAEHGPLANLPEALIRYRVHSRQITNLRYREMRLANALARYFADRRGRALCEGFVENGTLVTNAKNALSLLCQEEKLIEQNQARIALRLVESLGELCPKARTDILAALTKVARYCIATADIPIAAKFIREYLRVTVRALRSGFDRREE
jgi:glycosyltransferase involved in cell wall biosynthesis